MVLEEHRNLRRSRRLAYQRARLQQGLLMSVILLGTILCLTLGSLLTPDRTYSDSENRKLAQFPKLSWSAVKDGSWFSDLESYRGTSKMPVIPDTVKVIGASAFWRSDITGVTIPSSVKRIGASAFYECASLTSPRQR